MVPNLLQILRLVGLGLVVSALMMGYFKAGTSALNPLTGYKLWPKESRWQFIVGLVLLGVVELVNLIW